MVFKVKIWLMQKKKKKRERKEKGKKKGHSDALRSQAEWAARPVVTNSCARKQQMVHSSTAKAGAVQRL